MEERMIRFLEFDPKTAHRCDHCTHFLKVRKVLITFARCDIHKELDLNKNYNAMRRNDCEDWELNRKRNE